MTYYDLNSNCTKVYFHVDFLVHFQRLAQFADLEAMRTLKFVSWQESYLMYVTTDVDSSYKQIRHKID